MSEHPIESLMKVAMNSIKEISDVNTIVGEPLEIDEKTTIIPISKVALGFAAGGSEFSKETIEEYKKNDTDELVQYKLPFGGGSGAGINIVPIAFIIIQNGVVKVMPVNHSSVIDKLLDYMPDIVEKTNDLLDKCIQNTKVKKSNKIESKNEEEIL